MQKEILLQDKIQTILVYQRGLLNKLILYLKTDWMAQLQELLLKTV